MRLRTRLILGILVATLLPLLLLGLAATQHATRTVIQRVVELHVQKTTNVSTFVNTYMAAQVKGLALVMSAFPVGALKDKEKVGFERLVYNQFDDVNIVALLDAGGVDLAPSQFTHADRNETPATGHEAVTEARFIAFRSRIPIQDALATGAGIGLPYTPPDATAPVVPIAVARPGAEIVLLAVEISLRNVVQQLENQATGNLEVALLDTHGEVIAARGGQLLRPGVFDYFLGGAPEGDLRYELADGTRVLAAFTLVPSTGWLAVAAEPYEAAVSPGRDIRNRTAYFGVVAAALAVVLGMFFSARIHAPVEALRDAALTVGRGELGVQVMPDRIRELGDLGRAFNEMSLRLRLNRDEIEAQRREIENFNQELQARVDARTRELREAQAHLVESGKLAAVAELGAGLAHELNNPLAGVLGVAQVLKSTQKEGPSLALFSSLEAQALRCAEILKRLQGLTLAKATQSELDAVDLEQVMAEVVTLTRAAFQQRSVVVEHIRASAPLNVRADRAQLEGALTQLITSLRALVPDGGRLGVSGHRAPGEVRYAFTLSPEAPPPSLAGKDDWFASGMSLWVARRILAEHGGRLSEPEPDAPGCYHLVLPEA